MYYSEEIIDEVMGNNDIIDVISSYMRLEKKGGTHFGLCPFHNEKSPSFAVNQSRQMFKCFGCSASGSVITFVMKYENYTFPEAVEFLANRAGIKLPEVNITDAQKEKEKTKLAILEMNKLAAKYFYAQLKSDNASHALKYLENRELSPDTMTQFGLGYANKYSDDLLKYLRLKGYSDELIIKAGLANMSEDKGIYDKFWNRVIFPIMDTNNRVIGFGGRVMGEGKPKYLNSPETLVFDKSRNLYGLNRARTSRKPYFIICEGYMDVIALHQAGFTNAVASLGTAFTTGQANLIKRYVKDVYLTYDNDEAGTMAALRAVPILREVGINAKIIKMDPYKDPDEFIKALGAEAFEERIGKARNGFLYGLEVLEKNYDLNSPEGKTSFYKEMALRLIDFEEELERNNYIEAAATQYKIEVDALKNLVAKTAISKGLAPNYKRPKSLKKERKQKEDGSRVAQKILLTWMALDEHLFQCIKTHIKTENFTIGLYESVAKLLYKQYEVGAVNPAKILNNFTKEEEHLEVASLFHTEIKELSTNSEKEKAIKETIIKVKMAAYETAKSNLDPEDIIGLQRLMGMKKEIEDFEKLKITL